MRSRNRTCRPQFETLEGRCLPSATLVRDINPLDPPGEPRYLAEVGATLFFAVDDGAHGRELWKTDGTAAGTVLVKDILPGGAGSSPALMMNFNGTLFFTADDGTNGRELWKSDGTAAGTVLVKNINPGSVSSEPMGLTPMGGTLFFAAGVGPQWYSNRELWKSDGTTAGTVLVKDIFPGDQGSGPGLLTELDGTLFFTAFDGTRGSELWRSDGTAAGTVLVKDINPATSSEPRYLTVVNATLLFSASDGSNGRELWRSDGTDAGTVMVKDIAPGTCHGFFRCSSDPGRLTNVSGTLFFSATADGTYNWELWKSDGTAAGTVLVKDINPGYLPVVCDPYYGCFGGQPRSSTPLSLTNRGGRSSLRPVPRPRGGSCGRATAPKPAPPSSRTSTRAAVAGSTQPSPVRS